MKTLQLLLIIFIFFIPQSNLATYPVELLSKKFPAMEPGKEAKRYTGINFQQSIFARYNPISLFFNGSMYLYQKTISEQISAQCGFTPSCSEFSKNLILHYGLIKGVFLSADRLMRCNGHASDEYPAYRMDIMADKLIDSIEFYKWRSNF
jgi:putative component of membrane protein insertase Oxa1/YidC/SpoIIIJ protein YidD